LIKRHHQVDVPKGGLQELFERLNLHQQQLLAESEENSVDEIAVKSRLLVFTISAAYWLRSTKELPDAVEAARLILLHGEDDGFYHAQNISEHMDQMDFGREAELVDFLACWGDRVNQGP
jgi:hypothetical protein